MDSMQVSPVTTQLRDLHDDFLDAWHTAIEDGLISEVEIAALTAMLRSKTGLIARADDGVRLALSSLKGGSTRRTREGRQELQRLHGPIDFEAYKKRQAAEDGPDAA
jgi:hypothetical protein